MDAKLDSLIEKIKKDGIDEAQKKSGEMIEAARAKAKEIIEQAKEQAHIITEESQQKAQKLKENTEKSLRQAARDLVLALREQIVSIFDGILKRQIKEALSAEFLKSLIESMIKGWAKDKEVSLEVLVSREDCQKLEKLLSSTLKQEAKNTLEIKVSKAIDKGFRIGIKGEDVHYDFTDESIAEALKQFLNPAITKMLDVNNG